MSLQTTSLENHPIFRAVRCGFHEVRQAALLMAICADPGLSVREYAERVGVSKPCVTRATNALESAGLLSRRQGEVDRRLCVLRPTAAGTQLIAKLRGD